MARCEDGKRSKDAVSVRVEFPPTSEIEPLPDQEEDLNSPLVEEVIKAMIKRRQRGRIPLCLYCEKEARSKNNVEGQRKKANPHLPSKHQLNSPISLGR